MVLIGSEKQRGDGGGPRRQRRGGRGGTITRLRHATLVMCDQLHKSASSNGEKEKRKIHNRFKINAFSRQKKTHTHAAQQPPLTNKRRTQQYDAPWPASWQLHDYDEATPPPPPTFRPPYTYTPLFSNMTQPTTSSSPAPQHTNTNHNARLANCPALHLPINP